MTVASPLFAGKLVETAGAIALLYVACRVALIEWGNRHFYKKPPSKNADLMEIREKLTTITEYRRKQFGTYEALILVIGTFLVALGCTLYLYGLINEHAS